MNDQELRDFARVGAGVALAAILAEFPELRRDPFPKFSKTQRPRRSPKRATRQWTTAQRQAVSRRMATYWAMRRRKTAKKKG